jgi:DNA polymerase III subunit gamma/tau
LKFLEEPPPHTHIILCTTGSDRIPETILSRCISFEYAKFTSEQIITRLKSVCKAEGIEYEESALYLLSRNAKGGMRDALALLEKAILAGSGKVLQEVAAKITSSFDYRFILHVLRAILEQDMGKILKITNVVIFSMRLLKISMEFMLSN